VFSKPCLKFYPSIRPFTAVKKINDKNIEILEHDPLLVSVHNFQET